jgi:hypothetical protein
MNRAPAYNNINRQHKLCHMERNLLNLSRNLTKGLVTRVRFDVQFHLRFDGSCDSLTDMTVYTYRAICTKIADAISCPHC